MVKRLKYADLEHFLKDLGFEGKRVKGSHVYFEHLASGAAVALKDYQPDELVEPSNVVAVRGTLDGFGVLERDEFDRRLQEACTVNAK